MICLLSSNHRHSIRKPNNESTLENERVPHMLRHQLHESSMSKIVQTADKILEIISGMMDLNTFFMARVDHETSEIISVLNRKEKILDKNGIEPLHDVFCKFVVEEGQHSFAVNDLLSSARTRDMAINRLGSGGSFIGVPIVLKTGEIFGTLCAVDREEYEFKDKDTSLFRTMADLIAQIIELEWLSKHDPLTLMYNRNFLHEYFQSYVISGEAMALLFLDLDRFKLINDTAGHDVGDQLLKNFADRLCASMRKEDVIIRLGGDEFAIIIEDLYEKEDVAAIAERILDLLKEPFIIDGNEYIIETSIGISLFPYDTSDTDTLIKYADTAMYHAKEMGEAGYQFYSASMSELMYKKMSLELGIRKAIERNEFTLHYQPIVSNASGEIERLECLIRWEHPEWGFVPPSEFIPIAEEVGLIGKIGRWTLQEACRQNKTWQEHYVKIPVAINVSALELLQQQFIEQVKKVLEETGMEAEYLILEVTESMELQHIDCVVETLEALKAMGVKIAMDDFGTGFSSLNYFKILPLDIVKIDKSFINNMLHNCCDASIIEAVIHVATNMNLIVIAEGIETKEQFDFISSKGVDETQGYYLYPAVPAEEIGSVLKKR